MRHTSLRLCSIAVCLSAVTLGSRPAIAQQVDRPLTEQQLQRDLDRGRVPFGSFIRRPVKNTAELVRQLDSDELVVARYASLFGMSPSGVKMAFRQLRLTEMPEDRVMRVYFVHGERIGYKIRKVKKGTPIFAMPDGTPAIVVVCGNPLRPTITPPLASEEVPYLFENGGEFAVPPSLAELPLEAPVGVLPPGTTAPPPGVTEIAANVPIPPGFIEEARVLPPGALPRHDTNLTPLLALAALGGFIGITTGGGGGAFAPIPVPSPGGPVPGVPTPSPLPGPPPVGPNVPEPGSVAFAVCSAIGFAVVVRRNRQQRRSSRIEVQ